jgi:hypothetical protein
MMPSSHGILAFSRNQQFVGDGPAVCGVTTLAPLVGLVPRVVAVTPELLGISREVLLLPLAIEDVLPLPQGDAADRPVGDEPGGTFDGAAPVAPFMMPGPPAPVDPVGAPLGAVCAREIDARLTTAAVNNTFVIKGIADSIKRKGLPLGLTMRGRGSRFL